MCLHGESSGGARGGVSIRCSGGGHVTLVARQADKAGRVCRILAVGAGWKVS